MWRAIRTNRTVSALLAAAVLTLPAWASTGEARTAMPGTINYVEGQAAIGNEPLNSKSVGSAELQAGQSLTTDQGKGNFFSRLEFSCEWGTTAQRR